ncbi:hypothetical protein SDC9_138566 [bioreactor metagenome]|uniref:Uncharacterized protein n=1 Tax=bioreactor metagenome TaxID=1076179 RepID=A0A645DQ36_9ZZZZ
MNQLAGRRAQSLGLDRRQGDSDGHHVDIAAGADLLDGQRGHHIIAFAQGPDDVETLVGVDGATQRQSEVGIVEHRTPGLRGDHCREGGRGDRRLVVKVGRVGVPQRGGEFGYLGTAHPVRLGRRVDASDMVCRNGHPPKVSEAQTFNGRLRNADGRALWDGNETQRVSRCKVCLPSRLQNFISSRRSGVLRRFFLVM